MSQFAVQLFSEKSTEYEVASTPLGVSKGVSIVAFNKSVSMALRFTSASAVIYHF